MNKKICIILISFCYTLLAQNSNSEYYPLSVGNKWEYINLSYEVGTIPDTTYHLKEVIGDTILLNGIKYYIVKESGHIHFERFDSLTNEIKYYENGGCGGFDDSRYSLNYNPDSTVQWNQCGAIPYYISFEDTSNTLDTSFIILDSDHLVDEQTIFQKHLGIRTQTFLEVGMYVSRLIGAIINGHIWGTITSISERNTVIREYNLYPNYPNPFNPATTIKYSIPSFELIQIKIFDILGNELQTLVNQYKQPGNYKIEFSAGSIPSGVYFYKIISGSYSETRKMILLR